MKKEVLKKQLSFKTILIILFLGSLAFATYEAHGPFEGFNAKEETTELKEVEAIYFDYGVIADSTYCNDFFKFRIPISKGHQGDYKIYDYTSINILARDSVPAKPILSASIAEHDLLIIQPELVKIDIQDMIERRATANDLLNYGEKKRKLDFHGPDYNIVIRAHNLYGKALSSYTSQFSNINNPNYGDVRYKTISGLTFREFAGVQSQSTIPASVAFQLFGGKNKNITSFMADINGFALSITLFYQTEEQKEKLLVMVDGISFH
jgi:hypothetical protein